MMSRYILLALFYKEVDNGYFVHVSLRLCAMFPYSLEGHMPKFSYFKEKK